MNCMVTIVVCCVCASTAENQSAEMVLQEMERQYANIHLVALVEKHGTKQVCVCVCVCVCVHVRACVCRCVLLVSVLVPVHIHAHVCMAR